MTEKRFYMPESLAWDIGERFEKDLTIKDIVVADDAMVVMNSDWEKCCIINKDGNIIPESIFLRYSKNLPFTNIKYSNKCDYIDEPVLYLGHGYICQHFGHTLTEGIARFWPLIYPKYQELKVVFLHDANTHINEMTYKFLNALGVPRENVIVVSRNTRFKRMYIPKQSTNIRVDILPITRRLYDNISEKLCDDTIETYEKIYMSRGQMNDGRTFGERSIEKIFEKNGYKVIYPEKIPLEQQIALVKNCRYLAGLAGSALHLAFFMKPGGTVIQIKRNRTKSDNIDVQEMINRVSKLNTVFVYGSVETMPTLHFTQAPQCLGITSWLLKFFDDYGFKYTPDDIKPDVEEIARYNEKMREYQSVRTYLKF